MSYSNAQIQTGINTAKCCMGDYTCKMLSKAVNGQGYEATLLVNQELSIIIFALETYLTWEDEVCMTGEEIKKIIHRINKLCSCNCTEISGTTSVAAAQHTSASHTTLDHTE